MQLTIDCYVNDIWGYRLGRKRADILPWYSWGQTGLGTVNAVPLTFMWRNSKNGGDGNLDILRIKIGHLKGENKWEISGSLDSNELDIDGLKAAQRNELVVAGQNIIFSSKRWLI